MSPDAGGDEMTTMKLLALILITWTEVAHYEPPPEEDPVEVETAEIEK